MTLRRLLLVASALSLAACSAVKFTYNRLDWIAAWQVGKFVDLEPRQKELFEESFREVWQWHRGTQLPLYASDLRELAGAAARPMSEAKVEDYLERSRDRLALLMQQLVPDGAKVIQSFDEEQVQELVENLDERRRKEVEESTHQTLEELQQKAIESMTRSLKRWIGSPTREQTLRIQKWAKERAYAGSIWQQYQEAWSTAFTEVLQHRREADFQARLSALFDGGHVPYREEMAKIEEHNRRAWIAVMADLSVMLTPEQRRHFQEELRMLAANLDELARQAQAAD